MTVRPRGIVVAIDGPAGSGKSSTARAVAAALGYRHLDSGAFYRAITLAALDAGVPVEEWIGLTLPELDALGVGWEVADREVLLRVGDRDVSQAIRSPEVTQHVSRMAAVPAVREWLLGALRASGESGGLVADGRDIGTVVFPGAELKVYLVCDVAERARRRLAQEGETDPSPEQVDAEAIRLAERDRQDSGRTVAPLRRAADAVHVDTTGLDFTAQVRLISRLAQDRIGA